jgi:hypothetical protein
VFEKQKIHSSGKVASTLRGGRSSLKKRREEEFSKPRKFEPLQELFYCNSQIMLAKNSIEERLKTMKDDPLKVPSHQFRSA